ncbi:MAG: SpoIIE family protein phosphatase [Bryobacteraceae bacterium]
MPGEAEAAQAPAVGRHAAFTVINPSGQKSTVAIDRSPFVFGRQADNDLALRDNRVSRVHARIVREEGGYFLEDLNSRHGTFLNGERLELRTRLKHSDAVTFGFADGYQLVFQQVEPDMVRLAGQIGAGGPAGELSKLRALVEVARALRSSLSTQEVLESVVDAALSVTRSDRGFLFLKPSSAVPASGYSPAQRSWGGEVSPAAGTHGALGDSKDGMSRELELAVARDRQGARLTEADLRVPRRVIQRALDSRRDLLSMNFDPLVAGGEEADHSIASLDLRSVICLPLVRIRTQTAQDTIVSDPRDTFGLIYLDSKIELADLSAGNREVLQTLALEASTILENARLLEGERAKQRMEDELSIARQIQQTLLPENLPSTGWFRAAAASIPSQQVGGDIYDIARIDDDHWHFLLADVSGKGVSSALLAALLQGAFVLVPSETDGIAQMLAQLNRYVYERAEGEKYATLFYGALTRDGSLRWCNAGHCEPLVVHREGGMEALEGTSLPVGMLDYAEFEVRVALLRPGDKVVVYSDGVTDASDPAGERFGVERIRQVARMHAASAAAELHGALIQAVREFAGGAAQDDDVTLMVVEFRP